MDSDKLVWLLFGIAILACDGMIFIGCNREQNPTTIIDGCEYVRDYNSNSLTHKGNCRQCEERLRKIVREETNELLQ